MADTPEQLDVMFAPLDAGQIARLANFGKERDVQAGEILFEQGDAQHGVFVVLEGSIEIVSVATCDEEIIRTLGPGTFTGEINLLSGRRSLVKGRAGKAGRILEIGRENLQQIMQTHADLGEIFLRSFLLRRAYLIHNSVGDALLIGSA